MLLQAESGLLSITGDQQHTAKVGIPIADIATGLYAYNGILTALISRSQTTKGCSFEVSMLDSMGELMGYAYNYSMYSHETIPRCGTHHATISPYGSYPTKDEKVVMISIQNNRDVSALLLLFLIAMPVENIL